jgi:hypothetical protein
LALISRRQLLTRCSGAGLLHLDDPDRLSATAAYLAAAVPPDPEALSERERRQWLMLTAQLYCFSSRRLRLRRSLAATAPAASGGPSIRP